MRKTGNASGVADPGKALLAAFVTFVESQMPELLERLPRERGLVEADPWIPFTDWPWSRRYSRELAASGQIQGARKIGRSWVARQSALDRFIEGHGAPVLAASSGVDDGAEPTEEGFLAELGLRPCPAAPRRGAGRR